jgi:6-phosphogluconolactonase
MNEAVLVHADAADGGRAVAARLAEIARRAVHERGRFALAVSGGESPEPLFRELAARAAGVGADEPWWLFWCDERIVRTDDPRSNYGLARRLWLDPAGFPRENVHAVRTDLAAEASAGAYESELRSAFPGRGPSGAGATLDVVVLGIGPDGHTASLFPGRPSLAARDRWVVAEAAPGLAPPVPRVTMTLEGLGHARIAVFLAWGAGKRPILAKILADVHRGGPEGSVPAARVRPLEAIEWHVDADAWPPGSTVTDRSD